jgi:type II secretory pathway component GspD/PulD (secretin)
VAFVAALLLTACHGSVVTGGSGGALTGFGSGSDDLPPAGPGGMAYGEPLVHVAPHVAASIAHPVIAADGIALPDDEDEPLEDEPMEDESMEDESMDDASMDDASMEGTGDVVEFAEGGSPPMAAPADAPVELREAVMADRRRFLVNQKLETARGQMRAGDFEAAQRTIHEARDLEPANASAMQMERQIQAALGHRGGSAGQYADERALLTKIRIDEQRTKAAKLTSIGGMHAANDRFDSAIESFEDALFIMNTSPYQVDWGNIRKQAEDGLRQARTMQADAARMRRREAVEDSLTSLAREEESALIQEMERLAKWMGAAIEAYERNQFDLAESYAERILEVQPDNTRARDLQLAARRAQHDKRQLNFLRDEKIKFREWYDDIQMTRIPQDKVLKWPSRSFWEKITKVRATARPSFGEVDDDPEALALRKKIESTTVTVQVEEQEFPQVIKSLQVQTGFNIVIDARVQGTLADRRVNNLVLTDAQLSTVLNMLQAQGGDEGIVWTTRGNVILFTSKEFLNRNVVVQIHGVADLTAGLTNFIPPTIRLVGPDDVSDEEQPLFGSEQEEPIRPYGTADELVELIKGAVAPKFWEDGAGDIQTNGERTLVVKATPEVQAQVARFLDDLRGFAGIVVTVESRFLEVSENFLRDVGVDFRGLGAGTPGTLVNLDDVTNGLEDNSSAAFDNGGTGTQTGAALSPSAGAYFNDGRDGDFRARTENIFDNPLGTVLSSVGGASLTLGYLDDTQVSMIIRATEKTLSARTLTAPIITVYNTQRANLTMVNQISYIQDFDVEVAQTSFIADPIVGIIQDGLTLDVRPTVSNDRRYITLELQPTVARLRRPIQEFATSLASSFAPVIIQLPELRLQQARTTVRIPDQGSILIGGLKEIRTVDQSSETPFLGKLPLLSFLFSRKGRSDEVSHLLIIVRAQIVDLLEQEEGLMGAR